MGSTLTAISMVTAPETAGVMIRRSVGSHQASATCTRLHTTIRLANVAGPPAEIAVTMIAMNMAAGQVSTTWPAPNRPRCIACRAVMAAQISIAAKTLQVRYRSPRPAARIAIATVSTIGARLRAAPWNPTASAIDGGQASSGSKRMDCSALASLNARSIPLLLASAATSSGKS